MHSVQLSMISRPLRCVHVFLRGSRAFGFTGAHHTRTAPPQMVGTGEQGTGMGTSIAVRALRRGKQLPCCARLFPLLPREVTGKQVQGIDLVRVCGSLEAWLEIGSVQISGIDFGETRRLRRRCAPSRGDIGMIAGWATFRLRRESRCPKNLSWRTGANALIFAGK
jgi:hypothetical protein